MGWVVLHLAAGLLAASLLVGLVPGAIITALDGLTGSPLTVGPVTVPESPGLARAALMTASAVVVITVSIAGTALLGWLAARWAPVFLGPTSHDRLVLAEARLAAESEHTRLARELHDGIGHALTIISVQAAAGRRTSGAVSPASRPLEVIELTAQHALEELDSMLGLLRDNPAARHPEPDIRELDRLVALYRQSGMRLTADAVGLGDLTGLPSRTAYRIVAEGLNNAQRHGGGGSVEMRVDGARGHVTIDLWNPTEPLEGAARRREHGHGHGLDGIRERVRLFGGTAHAGLDSSGRWHLHASFPSGTSGTSRTSS
jgi:signal transduction histidine kinase